MKILICFLLLASPIFASDLEKRVEAIEKRVEKLEKLFKTDKTEKLEKLFKTEKCPCGKDCKCAGEWNPDCKCKDCKCTDFLYFTASWCGPCQRMKPVIKEVEKTGLKFTTVDIDKFPDVAKKFSVTSIPCFINKKTKERVVGIVDKSWFGVKANVSVEGHMDSQGYWVENGKRLGRVTAIDGQPVGQPVPSCKNCRW